MSKQGGYEYYPGSSLSGELIESRALAPLAQIPGQLLAHERMARMMALKEDQFEEQKRIQERAEILGAAKRREAGGGGGGGGGRGGSGGGAAGAAGAPYSYIDPATGMQRTGGAGPQSGWGPRTFAPGFDDIEAQRARDAAQLKAYLETEKQLRELTSPGAGVVPERAADPVADLLGEEYRAPAQAVIDPVALEAAYRAGSGESIPEGLPVERQGPPTQVQPGLASTEDPISERESARRIAEAHKGALREARGATASARRKAGTGAGIMEQITGQPTPTVTLPGPTKAEQLAEARRERGATGKAGPRASGADRLVESVEAQIKARDLKRPDILDRLGGATPNSMVEFVDILTGPMGKDIYSELKGRRPFKRGQGDLRAAYNDVAAHLQGLRDEGDKIGAERMAAAMNDEYRYSETVRKDFVKRSYSMLRGERSLKGKDDAFVMNLAEQMSREDTKALALKFLDRAQAERLRHIGNVVGLSQLRDKQKTREKKSKAWADQKAQDRQPTLDAIDEINAMLAIETDEAEKIRLGDKRKKLKDSLGEWSPEGDLGEGLLMQDPAGGRLATERKDRLAVAAAASKQGAINDAVLARAAYDQALETGTGVDKARKEMERTDAIARSLAPNWDAGLRAKEKAAREAEMTEGARLNFSERNALKGLLSQAWADNRAGEQDTPVTAEDENYAESMIAREESQGRPGHNRLSTMFRQMGTRRPPSGEDFLSIIAAVQEQYPGMRGPRTTPTPPRPPAPSPTPVVTQPERPAGGGPTDQQVIDRVLAQPGYAWDPTTQEFTSPEGNNFGISDARTRL